MGLRHCMIQRCLQEATSDAEGITGGLSDACSTCFVLACHPSRLAVRQCRELMAIIAKQDSVHADSSAERGAYFGQSTTRAVSVATRRPPAWLASRLKGCKTLWTVHRSSAPLCRSQPAADHQAEPMINKQHFHHIEAYAESSLCWNSKGCDYQQAQGDSEQSCEHRRRRQFQGTHRRCLDIPRRRDWTRG